MFPQSGPRAVGFVREPQAMSDVSVVVVTDNSEQVLDRYIEAMLPCREVLDCHLAAVALAAI